MENEKKIVAEIKHMKMNADSLTQVISRLLKKLEEEHVLTSAEVTEIVLGEEEQ